ncbi:sugar porter family MFS transporter [Phytohalomonas tamaricis]|uniref:sugar porter family MFS transporter n=1 Tax=Phytohalomonas tamaricis TaxID=2081032 RepID=UPI000D0BDF5F|nr:sugar porter family MFS transporter [Phytohalomonas tamaricis]
MADSASSSLMKEQTDKIVPMVWFSCALAALAGLLFGMDVGVISGAQAGIEATFQISEQMMGWIVGSMMLGAAIGAFGAGQISRLLGRKKSLLLSAVLFVAGSLLAAWSWSPAVLIAARILLGLAVGIASFTAPLYLSEIAPERIRGTTISMYQLMVTVGILAAFLSNTALSYLEGESWRWMLGVIAIPAVLLFVGVLMMPNSPRWLASQERYNEARQVLNKLRSGEHEVENEMDEIQESMKLEQHTSGWAMFRSNPNFRRSVTLGVALQLVQQFTGINVIMYYAPKIFQLTGFEDTAAQLWSTVIVGLVNVFATFIAIGFVDRWGRKPILYTGFAIMTVSMAVLGTLLNIGTTTAALQYTAMTALLVFVAGFAMSAGPLVWTLCAEIQPLKGRDFGITCSTVANWVANMIVGTYFLVIINNAGGPITFWLLAAINFLFVFFIAVFVPETKGISLEKIEKNLMSGKSLRNIGT